MKFRYLAISTILLTMTGLAWAAPDMHGPKQVQGVPGDAVATEHAGMDACDMSAMHTGMNMHENMPLMQEQMSQIQQAEDPARRAELVQQHMSTMEHMMQMMQDMHGMHSGNHMGHMMSQGMQMDHDAGSSQDL